jgi:hypothetical protein
MAMNLRQHRRWQLLRGNGRECTWMFFPMAGSAAERFCSRTPCHGQTDTTKWIYIGVLHHLDKGDACVNWVGYDIVNVSIRYCIVQLNKMKYNLGMKVLHKTKII